MKAKTLKRVFSIFLTTTKLISN